MRLKKNSILKYICCSSYKWYIINVRNAIFCKFSQVFFTILHVLFNIWFFSYFYSSVMFISHSLMWNVCRYFHFMKKSLTFTINLKPLHAFTKTQLFQSWKPVENKNTHLVHTSQPPTLLLSFFLRGTFFHSLEHWDISCTILGVLPKLFQHRKKIQWEGAT